jgi:hypothetical protein
MTQTTRFVLSQFFSLIGVEARRIVIERVIQGDSLFGDEFLAGRNSPVELYEGRKHGSFCLGIASNKLRRYGLELTKRTQLPWSGRPSLYQITSDSTNCIGCATAPIAYAFFFYE